MKPDTLHTSSSVCPSVLSGWLSPFAPRLSAVVKILDVGTREEGQMLAVVGTVYKEQKLKPSILDEYTNMVRGRPATGWMALQNTQAPLSHLSA